VSRKTSKRGKTWGDMEGDILAGWSFHFERTEKGPAWKGEEREIQGVSSEKPK